MRLKLIELSRRVDHFLLRDRAMAGAMTGIIAALAATTSPVVAQTLPEKSQEALQAGAAVPAAKPANASELSRERFRRKSAEAAQKQLEAMAAQLREQLAKEIAARKAAEIVAAELFSRVKLEDQIDAERRRLKGTGQAATPKRADTEGPELKAMVQELERKLKAAEWARKLAEAQLKVMSGNRQR